MGVHFLQHTLSTLTLTMATGPSPGVRAWGNFLLSRDSPCQLAAPLSCWPEGGSGKAVSPGKDSASASLCWPPPPWLLPWWDPNTPGSTLRKGRWESEEEETEGQRNQGGEKRRLQLLAQAVLQDQAAEQLQDKPGHHRNLVPSSFSDSVNIFQWVVLNPL